MVLLKSASALMESETILPMPTAAKAKASGPPSLLTPPSRPDLMPPAAFLPPLTPTLPRSPSIARDVAAPKPLALGMRVTYAEATSVGMTPPGTISVSGKGGSCAHEVASFITQTSAGVWAVGDSAVASGLQSRDDLGLRSGGLAPALVTLVPRSRVGLGLLLPGRDLVGQVVQVDEDLSLTTERVLPPGNRGGQS